MFPKYFISDICPGLVNLGNSCFLNAILQGLAPNASVVRWLSNFVDKNKNNNNYTNYLAYTMGKVLKGMYFINLIISESKSCIYAYYTKRQIQYVIGYIFLLSLRLRRQQFIHFTDETKKAYRTRHISVKKIFKNVIIH